MKSKKGFLILLAVCLLFSCCLGFFYGSVSLSFSEIFWALFHPKEKSIAVTLLYTLRIPRVLGGVLAGAGLSAAGVILQSLFHNSLASPNIIGVNSGAGFAVLCVMVGFPKLYSILPLAAFAGAFLTTLLIFGIAYKAHSAPSTIILAGVAISSFVSSGINTLTILYPDIAINATAFMVGGLSGITFNRIWFPMLYILIALFLSLIASPALNLLLLGDEVSISLGLNVPAARFLFIILASTLAGSVVSFAGLLGFVGLIVPHAARFFMGNDVRYLMPCSILLGASFVVLCDLLGRIIFSPYELPVGILMSFLGGPFFIVLLFKRKNKEV